MVDFQDDEREEYAIKLFKLIKDKSQGRSGVDAYLELNGKKLPFELKSTSRGSVTTVRDFGPDHIKKWEDKHWLIGVYEKGNAKYFLYGPPKRMQPWIKEKERYILPDFQLAQIMRHKLILEDLFKILGEKRIYTYNDASRLHKKQYSKEKYLELMDLKNGYSPERMLEILKDRAKYLIERGSTLNNPHIPASYFKEWPHITSNHAQTLKNMVKKALTLQRF